MAVFNKYKKKVGSIKKLQKLLKNSKIETRPVFYPMEIFKYLNYKKKNKTSYEISKTSISLPSGYDLNKKDIDKICKIIKKFVN